MFTREDGAGYHPETVTKTFSRLARTVGLPPIRLHDRRHGVGSLWLAGGADTAVVSKMLGHSSITITADTYSHLIGEVGRQTAEAGAALVPRRSRVAG